MSRRADCVGAVVRAWLRTVRLQTVQRLCLIQFSGSMRPTHYDALAEFLQYNCFALQELNLLGIWINGYKLCESMKKLRQIRHLSVPFIADGALMEVVSRTCAHLKSIGKSNFYFKISPLDGTLIIQNPILFSKKLVITR